MAAGPVEPLLVCGNDTARPPVPRSTEHDLRRGTVAPCQEWCNMTAVLAQSAKVIHSGIHNEASHTAFFKDVDRSVNKT